MITRASVFLLSLSRFVVAAVSEVGGVPHRFERTVPPVIVPLCPLMLLVTYTVQIWANSDNRAQGSKPGLNTDYKVQGSNPGEILITG